MGNISVNINGRVIFFGVSAKDIQFKSMDDNRDRARVTGKRSQMHSSLNELAVEAEYSDLPKSADIADLDRTLCQDSELIE